MKNLSSKSTIAALSIAASVAIAPHAYASDLGGEKSTVREAVAPAPSQDSTGYAPRSADGGSWAPGGAGSWNWLYVKGSGVNVTTASVAYVPGTGLASGNACADEFEIAYYENGQRITETAGSNCAIGRVTRTFNLNKNVDANTSFCGRVRIGDAWGNYACVNIRP